MTSNSYLRVYVTEQKAVMDTVRYTLDTVNNQQVVHLPASQFFCLKNALLLSINFETIFFIHLS
jgi:hypothetical protein